MTDVQYDPYRAIKGHQGNVFLERVDYGRAITFRMAVDSSQSPSGQKILAMLPVMFEERGEHAEMGAPAFSMDPALAQALADELWRVGFRPTQGRQSEGEAGARTAHLEDMRAIAFAKLDVQQPQPTHR